MTMLAACAMGKDDVIEAIGLAEARDGSRGGDKFNGPEEKRDSGVDEKLLCTTRQIR